jgi:hypothetical protein
MNQLAINFESAPAPADLASERERIGQLHWHCYRKYQRRNEIDGNPFVLGGAVVLHHRDKGASHCAILAWSAHTECGFDPLVPEGMSTESGSDVDLAAENFFGTYLPPSFQSPLATVICKRCYSVEGITMHVFEEAMGDLDGAFARLHGFTGTFWDAVRRELRRMPLTVAQVEAGELAPISAGRGNGP